MEFALVCHSMPSNTICTELRIQTHKIFTNSHSQFKGDINVSCFFVLFSVPWIFIIAIPCLFDVVHFPFFFSYFFFTCSFNFSVKNKIKKKTRNVRHSSNETNCLHFFFFFHKKLCFAEKGRRHSLVSFFRNSHYSLFFFFGK